MVPASREEFKPLNSDLFLIQTHPHNTPGIEWYIKLWEHVTLSPGSTSLAHTVQSNSRPYLQTKGKRQTENNIICKFCYCLTVFIAKEEAH
jgi:hypothetical protein